MVWSDLNQPGLGEALSKSCAGLQEPGGMRTPRYLQVTPGHLALLPPELGTPRQCPQSLQAAPCPFSTADPSAERAQPACRGAPSAAGLRKSR